MVHGSRAAHSKPASMENATFRKVLHVIQAHVAKMANTVVQTKVSMRHAPSAWTVSTDHVMLRLIHRVPCFGSYANRTPTAHAVSVSLRFPLPGRCPSRKLDSRMWMSSRFLPLMAGSHQAMASVRKIVPAMQPSAMISPMTSRNSAAKSCLSGTNLIHRKMKTAWN